MCGKVGSSPKVFAATLEDVFPLVFSCQFITNLYIAKILHNVNRKTISIFYEPVLYYELSFKYPDVWRLIVVRCVLMHCPKEEVVTVRSYMTKA